MVTYPWFHFQLKCYNDKGPQCWSTTQLGNAKFNYLLEQFQLTHNFSSILGGQDFVDSCQPLRDGEGDIVFEITGSRVKCTFLVFEESFKRFPICRDAAVSDRDNELDLLDFYSTVAAKR